MAISAPAVIALDALSFAIAVALTAINRWDRPPPSPRDGPDRPPAVPRDGRDRPAGRRLAAGWAWLRGDRYVRPLTLYLATNNLAAQAFQTALLLFVVRTLDRGPAAVGLAVAATGCGFLAGALVSPGAARRFGTGRVVIAASLIGALGIALVALAPAGTRSAGGAAELALVLVGAGLAGAGSGLFNLHSIAIRQAITPPTLLGRVNAVVKTISYGSATAGAFLGGVAATAFGPRAVIATAAALSAAATTCLLTPPIRTLTTTPVREEV
ncbi:MFS transporter [Paractinoplanes globisporus]|uniref:MFS transporter n=1 Tax=Paractinoplanes globisporus TaxID=113565 RepID=A0ABW6WW43_9ACTN|nr:MFS transporter [Actinoplanes globisporus]